MTNDKIYDNVLGPFKIKYFLLNVQNYTAISSSLEGQFVLFQTLNVTAF